MGRDRIIMTLTVSILAMAILTVFIAYFSFRDENAADKAEYAHADSLRLVAVVSMILF